jgi:hypothetical protein
VVTLVTEFGRTAHINGSAGTDHARGGSPSTSRGYRSCWRSGPDRDRASS